jgi:hypothetical protein
MAGKIIFEGESPKTQTIEGVKALITFHNHGEAPKEMPAFYRMSGEMVLVLSNKKDSYYVVTPRDCSCPARTFNPGKPCKHQRGYFPQPKKASEAKVQDSIKPVGKWAGGHNGPVPLDMPGGDLLKQMEKAGYEMSFEADY